MRQSGAPWGRGAIRTRFLITSLIIGTLSLILMALASFVSAYSTTVDRSSQIIQTTLQMASSMVDTQARGIQSLARDILANGTIRRELERENLSAEASLRITSALRPLCVNNTDIASIYLFNWDGLTYRYRSDGGASALPMRLGDYEKSAWYARTVKAQGGECYFLYNVLQPDPFAPSATDYSVSAVKLLRDLKTGEPYGIAVINVNKGYYASVYPSAMAEGKSCYALADAGSGHVNYLTALSGDRERMERSAGQYVQGEDVRGRYFLSTQENRRTGWTLLHLVEKCHFQGDFGWVFAMVLIAMLVLIGLSALLSVVAARSITRPMAWLSEAIDHVSRTGKVPRIHFGDDEVGRIGRQFVALAEQNEALSQTIIKLQVLEKEAEFNALQAQINPHFLYNALSSIYWLAKFGRADEAANMAVALSDIFKIALNRGDPMISVRREMQHVERYLYIQNLRYNGRIQVTWQVDEVLGDRRMLKLLIQPIVENALYHGLEPKKEEWRLRIHGTMEGSDMVFVVEDNGVGMNSEEALAGGYGLNNVKQRIRLKYGERYGCTFDSAPDRGTRVTIRIPCEEGRT